VFYRYAQLTNPRRGELGTPAQRGLLAGSSKSTLPGMCVEVPWVDLRGWRSMPATTPPLGADAWDSGRLSPMVNGLDGQAVALDFLDSPDVLRAVLLISQTALRATHFREALEVIAEQSLIAVNAASCSISRWERDSGSLRTLVNVGALGPVEQRWPEDELYPLAEYPYAAELLRHGRPYVHSVDDADVEPASMGVLTRLGKESQIGVPILHQGAMWGELWASGTQGRRFGPDDVRLLSAVATQASIAIARAEMFSEVARFAYEDPLTRLANRRRVDEALAAIDDDGSAATLLVGDVDGLKQINDRFGHPEGDEVLQSVAGALSGAASAYGALLVARLGGDEFCVILPGDALADAEEFAAHAGSIIAQETGARVSMCWGAAARGGDLNTARQLMLAADSALLNAKRLGSGRLWLHTAGPGTEALNPNRSRRRPPGGPGAVDVDVISRVAGVLSELKPLTVTTALECVAAECSQAMNAAAWSIWTTTPDCSGLRVLSGVDSRFDARGGLRTISKSDGDVRQVAEFSTAERALREREVFLASVEHSHADPAESEFLRARGYREVLGIGVRTRGTSYLIRLYFDTQRADLSAAAPIIRMLAHHCAHQYCEDT
jgi:diguanylate cyclase (GGDEF)-like protein